MNNTQDRGNARRTRAHDPLYAIRPMVPTASRPYADAERTRNNPSDSATILNRLRHDHADLRAVMHTLADHLDVLCLAGRPEYLFMLEALKYAGDYPNRVHHANEVCLFDALAARSARAQSKTALVHEQHLRLTALGRALKCQVDQILADARVNKNRLATCAWEYIALQRQHMTFEEKVIFPLLEGAFTSSDWDYFERTLTFPSRPFLPREIYPR